MSTTHFVPGAHDWPFVSQHPDLLSREERKRREARYMPALLKAWQAIEAFTGFRWKSTSYWRRSPSHSKGISLDLAPDIAPQFENQYAVNRGSDPVLYKREALIRSLQHMAAKTSVPGFKVGVFIEPDHLHVQLFSLTDDGPPIRIVKWKQQKPSYGDTAERIKLPILP